MLDNSGLFCGLLLLHVILASLATKLVARLQWFYMAINIL